MSTAANYISEVNAATPDGDTELVSAVDDYIRMLSRVLKTQFPNLAAAAVTATAADLNGVTGADAAGGVVFENRLAAANGVASLDGTSKIPAAQIPVLKYASVNDDLRFAAGTKMLFNSLPVPTTWTRQTSQNDRLLRLVDGNSALVNGTVGSLNFSTVFTSAYATTAATTGPVQRGTSTVDASPINHSHNVNLAVRYVDLVIATKDAVAT
jgi:hypothetical protein